MMDIAVPSTAKQLQAQRILHDYRNTILGNNLRTAVSTIDPETLHAEIVQYVNRESMLLLQASGIREEVVFALPCVLKQNPRLLGYYRLLMGISEKQFYTSASGLSIFKPMEHTGKTEGYSDSCIKDLCIAINTTMHVFLSNANKENLREDLGDLPLMTLGVYVDGVWRNIIGQQAAVHVFNTIKTIVKNTGARIGTDKEKLLVFSNSLDVQYKVMPSSDPDISIFKINRDHIDKLLCIEIKGGQDVANVHNRAGEAEKSHQKAALDGWHEKWTVIYLEGLQDDQRNKLSTESPSTDRWFDINEVAAGTGKSFDEFKALLLERFSLNDLW